MPAPSSTADLPLFPLAAVLYPGGRMQLRIFEHRYLEMVRECARHGSGFGVCLILDGHETGVAALPAAIGTLARIVDFYSGDDGLLGLAVEGAQRFRVMRTRVRDDGLVCGEVAWLAQEATQPVPVEYALLQTILERLIENMAPHWRDVPRSAYEDASWVGFRLAELLPLSSDEHQRLLELSDPLERLHEVQLILPRFQRP